MAKFAASAQQRYRPAEAANAKAASLAAFAHTFLCVSCVMSEALNQVGGCAAKALMLLLFYVGSSDVGVRSRVLRSLTSLLMMLSSTP